MTKGTRITLTKAQVETPTGKRLIDLILTMCHDGELDIREVEAMHIFLRADTSDISAIAYLRAITREIVADGAIDPTEALRLKCAFERVVPKEARGVVSTHLEALDLPTLEESESVPEWTRHEASAKQVDYIVALGGKPSRSMTKGEASKLIDMLLDRRPPTPRQRMLLRFFDRLDLANSTKDDVSSWIDEWFATNMQNELAWERFKRESNHDQFETDPEIVPVGAYRKYIGSSRQV